MRVLAATGLLVFGAVGSFGQTAGTVPAFEVASVKARSGGGEGRGRGDAAAGKPDTVTPTPGGVTMTNIRLKAVVQWAYHLQPIQVSGPGWMDSDRFDIMAKSPSPVTTDQLRTMMQALLAQRFKLQVHKETKEMQAYVVTVAKGGHKLKQSDGEGEMDLKPDVSKMKANFTHVTLAQFAEMASNPLQGVVVDETGLKGQWDFSLDITNVMDSKPANMDDAIGMIVQLVNQQLGIKIDQKKVPAEVLVVDHAERMPVEN